MRWRPDCVDHRPHLVEILPHVVNLLADGSRCKRLPPLWSAAVVTKRSKSEVLATSLLRPFMSWTTSRMLRARSLLGRLLCLGSYNDVSSPRPWCSPGICTCKWGRGLPFARLIQLPSLARVPVIVGCGVSQLSAGRPPSSTNSGVCWRCGCGGSRGAPYREEGVEGHFPNKMVLLM